MLGSLFPLPVLLKTVFSMLVRHVRLDYFLPLALQLNLTVAYMTSKRDERVQRTRGSWNEMTARYGETGTP